MILQRLRDVEDELTFGEYAGREGDIVAGVIQQGKDPRTVLVGLGKLEAVLPPAASDSSANVPISSRNCLRFG